MSAPIPDPSLPPDALAIVQALYAVRDVIAANNAALTRIADALAGKVELDDDAGHRCRSDAE
jgi:hypothetical protein